MGSAGAWRALHSGGPRDPEMNAKVNNAGEIWEAWRPFAPSIKREAARAYLENATDCPFMVLTAQVRADKRGPDSRGNACRRQRARPQTVEQESIHCTGDSSMSLASEPEYPW
jgi:predicted NodU family carbamoyl transferase